MSPTVSHCVIERTTPGRAVQVLNSALTFSRNTISGPIGVEVGGASTGYANFDHNVITGTSDTIAAMYCSGANVNIAKNTIHHQLTSATGTSSSAADETVDAFQANVCGLATPTIATGNSLLVGSATTLFVNAAGADNALVTIDDNDWHLAASAPASIRKVYS